MFYRKFKNKTLDWKCILYDNKLSNSLEIPADVTHFYLSANCAILNLARVLGNIWSSSDIFTLNALSSRHLISF